MLTVEDYGRIRVASRVDQMSVRQICRTFHHSHHTVRKALTHSQPPPYIRHKPRECPVLGPFKAIIDQILVDDQSAPRKQRHTAAKIYRRLRDEHGYRGAYDQVQRYVRTLCKRERETFVPLVKEPGRRMEADFGHIAVDFPEGRRRTPVLIVTWSYSGFRVAIPFPTERLECILDGLVRAFNVFGCVAKELWIDNPKTVATKIFEGRRRQMTKRYAELASHYVFEPLFCMPARGNEKSYVENSVYDLQRDWGTPVPKVNNYDDLAEYLLQCSLRKLDHRMSGKTQTIGQLFQEDKAAALALPEHPFDPYVKEHAKVDKYQTVCFQTNRYSVPKRWAFEKVTIKAYPFHIRIVAGDTEIARHDRCYGRNQQILEPLHYLAILGRRPASLDHSKVFGDWKLPECFGKLRDKLEQRHGPLGGARRYIRVLKLLSEHPLKRIEEAVRWNMAGSAVNVEMIINRANILAQGPGALESTDLGISCRQVTVPKPDLSKFDQYLTVNQGEPSYV